VKPKFYLTTAIPYVNALPHLGHSYELVATDVIARYRRLAGYDVLFLTGTDENSLNNERKARELGIPPQEYVTKMSAEWRKTWDALNISYDDFIRTTEDRHKRASRGFFQRAYDNGDIYKNVYEGFYCTSCEAFYEEEDLNAEALCPVHEMKCEWLSEENYFFSLSKYQDRLLKHIEENPGFIEPESRRNEIVAFIRRGLKDFSITRASMKWGIPTPVDESQVIYVWFDAVINYATGAGFPDDMEKFEKYWPCDLHVIGKDITRFHCIYWPTMLWSAGLPAPAKVFGHGFVTLKGAKMSKSRGIYVDPVQAVQEYGADAIRFFLVREIPFGQDGDFSWEAFVARYNADLANDLGNLLNRTLNLSTRNFDGKTPPRGTPDAADRELAEFAERCRVEYVALMDRHAIHAALEQAMALVRAANKYVADTAPWTLARDGQTERLAAVLYHALEAVRWAAVMVTPAMPTSAARIQAQLGITDADPPQDIASLTWGGLRSDAPLGDIAPVFPRIDLKEEPAPAAEPAMKSEPVADTIQIDDFAKVDLRLAEVLSAEPVPKSDKLLKLRVRVGDEERQIVAGIAQHYAPDQIVGKRIAIVANLAPRKVFGVESQGMLLAASDDGGLCVAEFDRPIASGSKVR